MKITEQEAFEILRDSIAEYFSKEDELSGEVVVTAKNINDLNGILDSDFEAGIEDILIWAIECMVKQEYKLKL